MHLCLGVYVFSVCLCICFNCFYLSTGITEMRQEKLQQRTHHEKQKHQQTRQPKGKAGMEVRHKENICSFIDDR